MSNKKTEVISENVVVDGVSYTFTTGRFAGQANGAVEVRIGDTIVLATAVSSRRDTVLDYFPLQVEYQEKLYAGGKIKGSRWVKREGRASDEAILTARLIDRSLRPLFPKGYKREVQIVVTVLSVDGLNDADIPALLAASAALSISNIPWAGPIGAVRVGLKDNKFIANPANGDRETSNLDLVVSGKGKAIVMVEAGAKEVSEEKMEEAFSYAQDRLEEFTQAIEKLVQKAGKTKQTFIVTEPDKKTVTEIEKEAKKVIADILKDGKYGELDISPLRDIKDALTEKLENENKNVIGAVVDDLWLRLSREQTLEENIRVDGRKPDQIRPLFIQAGILPRTHGSAIFQRGTTQALTITTLGSPREEQLLETMEGEETKRYIHHYFMPPYSVGETGRMGWPSRREVGHGALAERALMPMIPAEDVFPYTIRVVSEITSSNGSTSMASVCGSTLSLMDAGVPLVKPVAGIAMGLIVSSKIKDAANAGKTVTPESKDYVVLTDIMGEEDHLGDMDFKVAGSADGITALQMDIKILGVSKDILTNALAAAKKARLFILGKMLEVLPQPRPAISKYAPKIAIMHIDPEKIGDVIGSGGRVIKNIIKITGCQVDVEDDGTVAIIGTEPEAVSQALSWVDGLTREIHAEEEFDGTVKRIVDFGAFVEILPSREGLVHVSQIPGRPQHPDQALKLGDKVHVRVREIDDMGRVNLSMLFGKDAENQGPDSFRPQRRDFGARGGGGGHFGRRPSFGGGHRGPDRRDDRGGR